MKDSPPIPARYEIRETLLRTSQLVQLRAVDTTLAKEVVLEYPGDGARRLLATSSDREYVLREARLRAKIEHPGIQRLLTVLADHVVAGDGPAADCPVLVLDAVRGERLAEILERRQKLEPETVISLGKQLCDALHAVHARGVVHRAVAADNILLQADGRAVLTGFVFAKSFDVMGRSTMHYATSDDEFAVALPPHPAPEQVRGQPADPRADVFALGCVLYQCATGRPAFTDHLAAWAEPRDPDQLADLPRGFGDVIQRCLRPSPPARFSTMLELRDALTAIRVDEPSHRTRNWIGSVLAASAVAVLLAIWQPWSTSPSHARGPGGGHHAPAPTGFKYSARYAEAYAVLIGIDYEDSPFATLKNPETEVLEVRDRLADLGWNTDPDHVAILLGEDATHQAIVAAIDRIQNRADYNDQFFIYFAGHGSKHPTGRNSGYVLPADATPARGHDKGSNWLRVGAFTDTFKESRAKHVLVALACCHSGTALGSVAKLPPDPFDASMGPRSGRSCVVITATTDSQVAFDGVDVSPFAAEFLAALDDAIAGTPRSSYSIVSQMRDNSAPGSWLVTAMRMDAASDKYDFEFVKR